MSKQPANDIELEKAAIRKAILDFYHEGHVKSDPELYKQILHDEWKFFWFDNQGKLRITEKSEYLSWYDPENVDPDLKWETEFYYVDVTDNIGAAKIRLECQKVRYIDYFNLVKLNGKWRVVNKLSHSNHKK
jgi:hypothetical protein